MQPPWSKKKLFLNLKKIINRLKACTPEISADLYMGTVYKKPTFFTKGAATHPVCVQVLKNAYRIMGGRIPTITLSYKDDRAWAIPSLAEVNVGKYVSDEESKENMFHKVAHLFEGEIIRRLITGCTD